MDEPCSALDPISTGRIEDLMLELKQEYSIVIVTHNMQQAARVSDRTAFLIVELDADETHRWGRIVEYDETEKIFTNPTTSGPRTTSPARSADGRADADPLPGGARAARASGPSAGSTWWSRPSSGRWRRSSTRTSSWRSW